MYTKSKEGNNMAGIFSLKNNDGTEEELIAVDEVLYARRIRFTHRDG